MLNLVKKLEVKDIINLVDTLMRSLAWATHPQVKNLAASKPIKHDYSTKLTFFKTSVPGTPCRNTSANKRLQECRVRGASSASSELRVQ